MLYLLAFIAGLFAGVGVMCLFVCNEPDDVREAALRKMQER